MRELIVTIEGELEGHTESFYAHDGDAADQRANGEVDERRPSSISRYHAPDHPNGKAKDEEAVSQEGSLESIVEDLIYGLDLFVLWRIDDDDDSPH